MSHTMPHHQPLKTCPKGCCRRVDAGRSKWCLTWWFSRSWRGCAGWRRLGRRGGVRLPSGGSRGGFSSSSCGRRCARRGADAPMFGVVLLLAAQEWASGSSAVRDGQSRARVGDVRDDRRPSPGFSSSGELRGCRGSRRSGRRQGGQHGSSAGRPRRGRCPYARGCAPEPVVADGVAAVEVGDSVGTAVGRRQSVGAVFQGPAASSPAGTSLNWYCPAAQCAGVAGPPARSARGPGPVAPSRPHWSGKALPTSPTSNPANLPGHSTSTSSRFCISETVGTVYHQQTKNLLALCAGG